MSIASFSPQGITKQNETSEASDLTIWSFQMSTPLFLVSPFSYCNSEQKNYTMGSLEKMVCSKLPTISTCKRHQVKQAQVAQYFDEKKNCSGLVTSEVLN